MEEVASLAYAQMYWRQPLLLAFSRDGGAEKRHAHWSKPYGLTELVPLGDAHLVNDPLVRTLTPPLSSSRQYGFTPDLDFILRQGVKPAAHHIVILDMNRLICCEERQTCVPAFRTRSPTARARREGRTCTEVMR
jgi:hypothetical protein